MDYEESMKLFDLIRQTGNKNDENWMKLYYDFLEHVVKIARTRAQTYFKTPKDIVEEGKSMAGQYYNLITSIDSLARYANVKGWNASLETIMDRGLNDLGDFACYIHAIIGVSWKQEKREHLDEQKL